MANATCRSCDAEIVWAEMASGKSSPFDAKPDPKGAWVIVSGKAIKATATDDKLGRERFTNHFATCPDGDDWRSKR